MQRKEERTKMKNQSSSASLEDFQIWKVSYGFEVNLLGEKIRKKFPV